MEWKSALPCAAVNRFRRLAFCESPVSFSRGRSNADDRTTDPSAINDSQDQRSCAARSVDGLGFSAQENRLPFRQLVVALAARNADSTTNSAKPRQHLGSWKELQAMHFVGSAKMSTYLAKGCDMTSQPFCVFFNSRVTKPVVIVPHMVD